MIVAFPEVDPSIILLPEASDAASELHFRRKLVRNELSKGAANSFDKPHLWYSTSDVIYALTLFLASGDELSNSNTFR